jgi:hypothetical protein
MVISDKCEIVLSQPLTKDVCYDFRTIRQRTMCLAWKIMDEQKIPFRQAIKEAWRTVKEGCAKVSAAV